MQTTNHTSYRRKWISAACRDPLSFDALSEYPNEKEIPLLDRQDIDESTLTAQQKQWREEGFLILKDFIPENIMQQYCEVRQELQLPGGYACDVPYMHIPQIRQLCLYRPLTKIMASLIGQEMGLHLNLTNWVSTERQWHQDDYLNPNFVNSWYIAVWIALDSIHENSGPFQYVPGSHRWKMMRGEKVRQQLSPEEASDPAWPRIAERFVTKAYTDEIKRQNSEIKTFLGQRGDVLLWHGRLVHQGSKPKIPGMVRKGLIAHYSAIDKRPDMPFIAKTAEGSSYFIIDQAIDAKKHHTKPKTYTYSGNGFNN